MLFRHQEAKKIYLYAREYTMPRDQEGTRVKGWIHSNVRFGPVSDIKVCNHYGRYSIEVQYQSNPNYPHQFLFLRAIQGHSGSTINPALQDNVLLPKSVTEFFYHVGNGKELRSTVNHGLRTGRQAVFFTIVNPMDNQDGLGETLCDLSQARIAPYTNTWKRFQNSIFGAI